jgi:hypothetical protein
MSDELKEFGVGFATATILAIVIACLQVPPYVEHQLWRQREGAAEGGPGRGLCRLQEGRRPGQARRRPCEATASGG